MGEITHSTCLYVSVNCFAHSVHENSSVVRTNQLWRQHVELRIICIFNIEFQADCSSFLPVNKSDRQTSSCLFKKDYTRRYEVFLLQKYNKKKEVVEHCNFEVHKHLKLICYFAS